MIALRPLNLETDAARYAELGTIVSPKPITVERVREWEEQFPHDGIRQCIVALDANGGIIGCNSAAHVPYMLPHSFWIEVIVLPDFCGAGLARAGTTTRSSLREPKARRAWNVKCATTIAIGSSSRKRAVFKLTATFESSLDLARFDEARFAGVIEAEQAQDIRFCTLADAGNTEANQRKLYELNKRNALDIPGSEGTFPRFEDFSKFVFGASWFRAEGQILAADGERWVGLSAVGYFANTYSTYNMHTGVLREYRGRKIALALKLLAIRRSREWGAVYLRTNDDSQNAPILAINGKLGYKPQPGYFRCVKRLDPDNLGVRVPSSM